MIKRSSSLLKLRMWSTLRTIRTRMLPRILMNSKTIPRKVEMLVSLNRAQVPNRVLAAKKTVQVLVVPKRVLAVQVLSKAQVAKKTVLAQVLAAKKMALALVVPKRVLAVQVLSKARAARKMVLAQAEKRTVLALAERPARRKNTNRIKRRNSRSMIGEK